MPDDAESDAEFFDCADQFIRAANSLSQTMPTSRISAALMFASARYSAFNALHDGKPTPEQRDEYIDLLVEQFRAMLVDNFGDDLVGRATTD